MKLRRLGTLVCVGAFGVGLGGEAVGEQPPRAVEQPVAPPGAGFSPDSQANPGVVRTPGKRAADRTMGPLGRGIAGQGETGLTIYGDALSGLVTEPGFTPERTEFHVVGTGDTLWDICKLHFKDPYLWPKIWSFNDQITNAHWIFPGDRIRLTDPFDRADDDLEGGPKLRFSRADYTPPEDMTTYILNQFAYIDEEQLEHAYEIVGGAKAKVMMADMDIAYLGYPPSNPPIAGERLAVYEVQQPIYDLVLKEEEGRRQKVERGKILGYLVEIVGEVYVRNLAKKSAEVEVVDSIRPVERGQKVGELRHRFHRIRPKPAKVSDVGVVIEVTGLSTVAGEFQFVIINFGKNRGMVRGNVLEVVHKGDAYSDDHNYTIPYQSGHPRRVIGHILALQVHNKSTLGFVIRSSREIVEGDPVELRVPTMGESEQARRRGSAIKITGKVNAKIGE